MPAVLDRHLIEAVSAQAPTVLVLEDERSIQGLVAAMARTRGSSCDVAGSLDEARRLMGTRHYDILFVDVNLPDGSGLSLARGDRDHVIIVMTGDDDLQTAIKAIRAGASDFVLKPFSVGDFLSRFDKAREEWRTREKIERYARALETLVRIKSEELFQSSRRFEEVCDMTVASLGAALNLKDHETADHCVRVSRNSVSLGRRLQLSDFELRNLRWGAYLHDVGKIGIPESILLKPGELSPGERDTMKKHPLMGYAMLHGIEFLAHSTDVVLSHHERYDGMGYPHGLRGTSIPLNARIFALLDALDAMTSRRPYREPLDFSEAARELERMAGSQFDPEILEVFLRAPSLTWMFQETSVGKECANRGNARPLLPRCTRGGFSSAPAPAAAGGPSSRSAGSSPW